MLTVVVDGMRKVSKSTSDTLIRVWSWSKETNVDC